ncbi:amidohydrolase family protein [Algoriphagus halophilus]
MIDRIMYGSDAMYWPDNVKTSIETLDSFKFLSEEDKRKIFYENALEFFELDYLKK